ncbi:pseudouridine synthase [Pseudorhodoferax sp. Leaf267]|uniref:pseudouridine synthase n=1 Tax=Pseudorhodoferax sp. Leaf267 TaxID=1736316 RepID=UPI0006F4423B|nr:pseudouridine synthase [Pseudorhodoferax sp. Leaf267]KQP15134.1 pseudouridine synthase [Pseudorhodoferax sp. Leaf267]
MPPDTLPRHAAPLPTRDGVGASCVGLAAGPWPTWLDFFAERFPHVTPEAWRMRMGRGEVVDAQGRPLAPDAPYRPHGRAWYYRSLDDEPRVPFEAQVLYRDAHLLVADKPHFLAVTPGGRYLHETLLTRLRRATGLADLQPLHRIDRETAGLVLFGLRREDRAAYHAMFSARQIDKAYEAIAPLRPGLVLPLTRASRIVRGEPFFRQREAEGEPNASTQVALVESGAGWGRYALAPRTGQRHQLRVHMAALGIPIRDDAFYPQVLRGPDEPDDYRRPLQLLARGIAFTDPVTGAPRRFESALSLQPLPAQTAKSDDASARR